MDRRAIWRYAAFVSESSEPRQWPELYAYAADVLRQSLLVGQHERAIRGIETLT